MSTEEPGPAPGRLKNIGTRSAIRSGEGSFRGLLSGLSKTADRSGNGPSYREMGTAYYLREEMHSARQAVKQLDVAVSAAQSFREAASKLREEAHRAMARLERAVAQVMNSEYVDPDLIGIACDITCAAKRGITLVDVYGKYSTMVKIMTIFLRSYIHSKFEKQTELLKKLNPSIPVQASVHRSQMPLPPVPAAQPQQHTSSTASVQSTPSANTVGGGPLSVIPEAHSQLGRSSVGMAPTSQAVAPPVIPQAPVVAPQPPASTQPLVGKMLQCNRHEKVLAMTYVPAAQVQASEYMCIWWSVGQRMEFYSEATQSTTVFQEASSVTALGIDDSGSVWTGHSKGQVRVRYKQQWERTVEGKAFTTAVRAIAFDDLGRAWTGDESGRMKVMAYEPQGGQLAIVASLQRSPALWAKMKVTPGNLFGKRHCNSGTSNQASAAAVFAAATATAVTVANSVAAAAVAAATTATGHDNSPGGAGTMGVAAVATAATTSSGGNNGHSGYNSTPPGTMEGPVRCIFVRGDRAWASGGRSYAWLQLWDTDTLQDLDVFECGTLGPCHAMASLRWPSASSAGPSLHITTGGQHRHTHSDGSRAAQPPSTGGASGKPMSSWRLLTGHENGQLLLWHPGHRNLAPLLRIGDPGSPCRGIAAFEGFNLVVTGHQGGQLHLFRQPAAESALPPGADSVSPQSLGTHRPKMVVVTAHKSRLDRMTCNATSCVTASILGTIRLWHAADLAAEAQRLGLVFTQHTASYGSLQGAELSQTGMLHASSTSSQFARDAAKCLALEFPQHASGQLASPVLMGGIGSSLGTGPLTAAASAMSSIPSATLLPTSGGTNASGIGVALHQHLRQSSKDSMDTASGTQPNSSNTAGTCQSTTDGLGTSSHPGQVPSGASFQHFQTIDYSELQMQRKIGSGAYGEVLLADWTGSEVAVKKLFAVQNMNDKEYSSLVNEVTLLGSLNHPNIARFLAMCEDPPCIVMQYYPYGSLFDLLNRAQKGSPKAAKELTWSKRLDMLRDVASGMQYLHSRKPPVIHGDLRSPNLLLDLTIDRERPRFHVRIADFGLARMANGATGSVMVSKMTNPRWLAPEVIRNSSVGKAADVYSFSIIMWEMLTWKQPYQDMMSVQVMFSTVTENSRPEVPPDVELPGGPGTSLPMYLQLMERCWQADASLRPSFKDIVEVLQNMQKAETDSPRPQRPHQQPPAAGPVQMSQRSQQQQPGRAIGGSNGATGYTPSPPAAGGNDDGDGAATMMGVQDTARESASAPTTGGNGVPPAAAAVAAAARRTISTGVTSPFMCTTALTAPGEVQVDDSGGAILSDGGQGSHVAKQYSSVLPPFGMSPILEETGSATPSISQQLIERPTATMVGAGVPAVSAAVCAESAICPPAASTIQQQQHVSLQHVHVARSSLFSQQAAGGAPASVPVSVSCPVSPAPHTSTAAAVPASVPCFAGSDHNPLSSASSAENGILHDVSGGSNIAGMPTTAESARQSPTSTSGGAIGTAVAVVTTNAAALPAAPAVSGKTGAAPAATNAAGQGGSELNANWRAGGSEAAMGPGVSRKGLSMEASNAGGQGPRLADTGGGTAEVPLWPVYSTPMVAANAITCLSPFASIPAAQLGELDAAAPRLAAVPGEHLFGAVAASHVRAAPPSPRNAVMARGIAAGSVPHVGARARGASAAGGPGHHANGMQGTPSSGRGRVPGAFIGHGAPPRTGGTIGGGGPTPSGTPRSGGSGSNSQPGTPPHAGPAAASPVRRGSGGYGSRQGSITGLTGSGVPAPSIPGRSHSGEGQSGGSSRRRRIGSTSGDAAVPRALAVSSQLSLLAGRLSHSAAHPHVDGHDDHAMGTSGRPGHRRTPSGGSIGSPAVGRGRGLGPLVQEGPPELHPRTPTRGSNYLASPRVPILSTVSSMADQRAMPAARRNQHAMPPSTGTSAAFDVVGSPSVPSPSHISRLAAAARPPGSPRSHIPGGPGPAVAHHLAVSTAATGAVSRIPSLAQAVTHGSGQTEPTKSFAYRSLDDLRRFDLCREVSSSPPMGSAVGSPTIVTRATAPPVADSAWEEGLDSVQRSPEHTQEVTLDNGVTDGRVADSVVQQTRPAAASGEPDSSLRRVVPSEQPAACTGMAAAAARQPAPLLAATAREGQSPFAAAVYPGASFDGNGAAGRSEEALREAAEADLVRKAACVLDNRTGPGAAIVSTPSTAQSNPRTEKPFVNDPHALVAGAASPATVSTVPAALARVTAVAQKSPFAQAAEEDTWWEDQHHDD